nr:hypothetical protein [Bacillota bacterium]
MDVVPRAWTLAYGVMSEQTFPDELPPAAEGPEPAGAWVIETTREYVEKSIATLKAQTQGVWRWE